MPAATTALVQLLRGLHDHRRRALPGHLDADMPATGAFQRPDIQVADRVMRLDADQAGLAAAFYAFGFERHDRLVSGFDYPTPILLFSAKIKKKLYCSKAYAI